MTEASRRGDELLANAKAQQAANRASLLRSQQEQRDLGAIGRLGGLAQIKTAIAAIGGITLYATGDPPRRRPEPPTPTLAKQNNHNIAWLCTGLLGTYPNSSIESFYITSGDGNSSLELQYNSRLLPFPDPPFYTFWRFVGNPRLSYVNREISDSDYDYTLLPINADSAILIIAYAVNNAIATYAYEEILYEGNYEKFVNLTPDPLGLIEIGTVVYRISDTVPTSVQTASDKNVYAVYVSKTSVRLLNTPTQVKNAFGFTIDEPTTITTTDTYYKQDPDPDIPYLVPYTVTATYLSTANVSKATYNTNIESYFATTKFNDIYAGSFSGNEYNDIYFEFIGPGIYTYLKNPAAANAAYAEFANDQDLYDYINTPYLPLKTISLSSINLKLDTLLEYNGPIPADSSYYPVYDADDNLIENPVWRRYSVKRIVPQQPDNPYYNSPNPLYAKDIALIYWDWNQPAYCREQLLALGFTEADLTP